MNNLIMGTVFGLTNEQVYPFFHSLRKCYAGECIIFLDNANPENLDSLAQKYDIELIKYDKRIIPTVQSKQNYLEYLLRNKYDNVMLTCVRDVIWQGDPFIYDRDNLHLYKVADGVTIGMCHYSGLWVKAFWGEAELERVKNNTPISYGTFLGSYSEVVKHLTLMLEVMNANHNMVDQALLNYNVEHQIGTQRTVVHKNGDNILTMGNMRREDIRQGERGYFLNDKAQKVSVVHQWDRHISLENITKIVNNF